VLDTLLGPEGSGLCALSFWATPRVSVGWLWAVITVEPPGVVLGRRRCW